MTAVRGWVAPLALVLLTATCGAVATESFRRPAVAHTDAADPPAAPMLSPRRIPTLLARLEGMARLRARLDALWSDASLGAARAESCVVVRSSTDEVYSRHPTTALIPASTLKVLTATAAVARLGAETRLSTSVRAVAPVAAGVITGSLWIVGGGDPLLATAEYAASFRNQPQVRTPVEDLVRSIVAAGVREVRGSVVGDESRYDTVRYIPTWKPTYLRDAEVGPASALLINDGFAQFERRKVATAAPALHAAQVVSERLEAAGVTVVGAPAAGRAPASTVEVAAVSSPPMTEVVGEMLRESDNTTAELLTKELGARFAGAGTTSAGVGVIRETLASLGLPAEGFSSADGSGLDRSDRASCGLVMGALLRAGPGSWLDQGLSVAARTGTLAQRFERNPAAGRLRAKTGALQGVTALSGWIDAPNGEVLAFAMIANSVANEAAGRALQERLGEILATYPEGAPAASLSPGGG